MAQLLQPAAPDPGRISQILPAVKCSSCAQPVPIAELGDHICQPGSPVPSLAGKPLVSPLTALELDPAKHQSRVAFPVKTIQAQQPVSSHQVSAPSIQHASLSGQTRARAPSTSSSRGRDVRAEPERSHAATPSDAWRTPFSSRPGPSEASPFHVRSPLAGQDAPNAEVPFPTARTSVSSSRSYTPRPRAPSSASTRPSPLSPSEARQPVLSSPAPYTPPPFSANPPAGLSSPSVRPRATTHAGPPADNVGQIIYSTDQRHVPPPTAPLPSRTPPNNHESPLSPPGRPRMPSTASLPPPQSLRARAPSTASIGPNPHYSHEHPPHSAPGRPPFERRPSNLGAGPSATPTPPPQTPAPQVDTKTGGEAGMAGVGRRGFAAAAHAALFLAHFEPRNGPVEHELPPSMVPGQGMDGRRANAPKFLDIASATTYASVHTAHTPPLSPANSGTSTLSPRSPFSQKSPVSAGVPSPLSRTHPAALTSPSAPIVASSPTSPVGSALRHDRVVSPGMEPPKTPLSATPTTPSAASIRLPFFEKFKDSKLRSELQPEDNLDTTAPDSDTESDYGGLAYARSSADEDEDEDKPLKTKLPPISTSVTPASDSDHKDKVRFPSIAGSESHYSESPVSPRLPQRSLSASTGTSTYSARTIAKSTGALDRVMETLLEDVVSPSTSAAASPAPLTAPLLPENQRDSRPPKLPTRSHTSPTLGTGRVEQARGKKRVKERVCAKCTKIIDDGRWIQMEGGSVLCDKCWKSMYLPKCRRCGLTIEKQAVSSSDGQLKGKYHRDCFNCSQCHKSFPDKSFYVFDGKPFCAYHYHEANNSLCAAATCGQPIEGPCAVSHAGQRFHPAHFLCEYPRCAERLVEYWEVDGRMLCERHAQTAEEEEELADEFADMAITRDSIAVKRITRFIDLAGLGGSELR